VICVDAASDRRVDGASRARLLLGSACMTPLRENGKVFGLLAVFRQEAGQFTDGQFDTLNTVAESILRSVLR
jgi:GAF domain-containing protein